jgi:hypothetical protein
MRKFIFLVVCIVMAISQVSAQNRTITGRVVSQTGDPLAGATIAVVGATASTTAGQDGSFTLNAPQNARQIEISFVGYSPQRISIGNQNSIDVELAASSSRIDEIIVTGYRTSSKRDFVGSASTVRADKVRTVPIASFDQALQGQVPGILIQAQSGQPGAAAAVLIRGPRISAGEQQSPIYPRWD